MRTPILLALAPLIAGATAPEPVLEIEIEGLRNAKGVIQACLTRKARGFPDCEHDPQALTVTAPAGDGSVRFAGFAPGRYAVTLFHDENQNRKLDKLIAVPREGFGFSRNPAIRFGAPGFDETEIELPAGITRHTIRMRYLL